MIWVDAGGPCRESHKTFEDYCGERWGIARNYANKMISAALVLENLGTMVPKPETERQARPLSKLPESKQAEVWESVVEKAKKEERKVTAKVMENLTTIVVKPATESQARPLSKLPESKQAEVWESVVIPSGGMSEPPTGTP